MTITSLHITNFRNLAEVALVTCHNGLNIISGNNGSGKTSLLEAIYYLGLGRSFRTSAASRLIRQTADKFSMFSQLINDAQRDISIGVEREITGTTKLRVAEKDASSVAELAYYLPIRLINSQSHNLFESGPAFRRKYLDWGLFYQSEAFLFHWRQYERVLKQRNVLLRNRCSKRELDAWTDELLKYGVTLDMLRREYVEELAPLIIEITQELLAIPHLKYHYQSGWGDGIDYASVLADSYHEEVRSGHTLFGPHRADLEISMDGIPVKHFLSRGQQKLLICAMITAQGNLLTRQAKKGLIYLVDDLPAELDLASRQKLISMLSRQQQAQIFITAIESKMICELLGEPAEVPIKVFHVEHGRVAEGKEFPCFLAKTSSGI
ncbi:MAG: DNA replication/repair protein RecF [Gammaproteobacteria bacterium]|nr:DNA replication/repair protein RecF [Gammaproteobacteria bacterium]MCW5582633.1 DNA replication/repair protein RecF [Gammaproteobacteria bacterium]